MLRLFLADSRRRAGQQLNCCSGPSPSLPAKKPLLQAAGGKPFGPPSVLTFLQVLCQLRSGCQERAGMLREGVQVAQEQHGPLTVGHPLHSGTHSGTLLVFLYSKPTIDNLLLELHLV